MRQTGRQDEAVDRQIFERHRDEVLNFKRDDLRELGRVIEGEGEGANEEILAGNRRDQSISGVESMAPQETSKRLDAPRGFQILRAGKRQGVLKVIDGFAPAQSATKPDGLQPGLSDIQPDTFVDNCHESTFVSCFKFHVSGLRSRLSLTSNSKPETRNSKPGSPRLLYNAIRACAKVPTILTVMGVPEGNGGRPSVAAFDANPGPGMIVTVSAS